MNFIRMLVEAIFHIIANALGLMTAALQLLPQVARAVVFVGRAFLALSCSFYRWLFAAIPLIRQAVHQPVWRFILCVTLSISLGFALCWLAAWEFDRWKLVAFVVHGLVVAAVWDDLSPPGSISLGV